tara:strand:- start:790 stop:1254 length:465 start_codon:yes stop_codon:yes gene_type:complete
MTVFQKIPAPTDFSGRSRRAIAFAAEQARLNNAELHLFHSVTSDIVGHPMDAAVAIPVSDEMMNEARKSLLRFPETGAEVNQSKCSGLEIVRMVQQESPEIQIVDYARKHQIDLIVLATHARSGVERLLMGSTAEAILRHSPCPLLIVPPPGNE